MNILRYKGILVYQRMPTVSCTAFFVDVRPVAEGGAEDLIG